MHHRFWTCARRKGGRRCEYRASNGWKAPSQTLNAVRSARASCASKISPALQTQPLYGHLAPTGSVDTRYLRSHRRCVHDQAIREVGGRIRVHPPRKTSMILGSPLVHTKDSGMSPFAMPPQVVRKPCMSMRLGRKSRAHGRRTWARGGRRSRVPNCARYPENRALRALIKEAERQAPMRFEKSAPASSNGRWRHTSKTCPEFVWVRMVFRKVNLKGGLT